MKHFALITFSALLLFSFIGCRKGVADFTLTGTITDNSFSVPLSGATVKLYATEAGGLSVELIATSTLGSDGIYSFTFERGKTETYHVSVSKTGYFELYEDIPFSDLTIEEDNVRDYATTTKSWVELRFINTSPLTDDVLQYIKQEGKSDCADCCTDGDVYLEGAIDTSIYCINDGNSEYRYYYWVHNSTNQGPKSAITPPFDTVQILLSY